MKKRILILISVFCFGLLLNGCGKKSTSEIKDLTAMQNQIFDISQKLQNGQISVEEAEKLTNELEEKYSELTENSIEDSFKQAKEQFEKINETLISLPDRAKKLGLTQPVGMQLIQSKSQETTFNLSGYDSIVLVYSGEYEVAMQQAKEIAKKSNIPMNKDFLNAKKSVDQLPENLKSLGTGFLDSMKGLAYTNYSLTDSSKKDYLITITVDADGTLIIEAVNNIQKTGKF